MKYKTIVIDPPWLLEPAFKKQKDCNWFACSNIPYKTMTDAEIELFPINNFAEDECDIFMWTTHTKLPVALTILKSWGFKYHVLLTWDKLGGVSINGFHRKTEFAVYGYRGKMGIDINEGNYVPTLFKAKATGHSQKPDIFYAMLEKRTKAPRIDIFARKRHYGFDAYGDQVETDIQHPITLFNSV